MKRIVHYLNQFYGQIGGEGVCRPGTNPAGRHCGTRHRAAGCSGEKAEIVATIICGDNYFADHQEDALETILTMTEGLEPDMFIAGPGFNAGRYGLGLRNYLR